MKISIAFNTAGKTATTTEDLPVERSIKLTFRIHILEGPARVREQITRISAIHTMLTTGHRNRRRILRGMDLLSATTSLAHMGAQVPPIGTVRMGVPEGDTSEGVTVVTMGILRVVTVGTGVPIRTAIIRRLHMGEGEGIDGWISMDGCYIV
jgi:hypothetical protein